MEQQAQSSSKKVFIEDKNAESADSGWTCMCIWSQKPTDQVSSASTTEDLTQSSTDLTETSSLKEEINMDNFNMDRQASPQVSDAPKPGKWTCIKKCLLCQLSDIQEPTETDNEITQSSTDPSNFSTSSTKEVIELNNLDHVQQASSALVSAGNVDTGGFQEGSVKDTGAANLQLKQGASSKQELRDNPNASSPDLAFETEV